MRKQHFLQTTLLALIASSMLFTFTCGLKERDPKGQKITFWHAMGVGGHRKAIQDITNSFHAPPDTEIQPIYQGGYSDLYQKLIAAITAGTNPSMSQMYESWTSRFYNRGRILSLNEFIDANPELKKDINEDFYNVFIVGNTWDGKLLSLPFNKSAYVLFYNADMIRDAGFNGPPQTWDELRDICQAVQEKKLAQWGFAMRATLESLTTLLYANEGQYLSDDGTQILIDSPAARQTIQFLYDMLFTWKIAYVETNYLSSGFGSEKFAMYIGSTAAFPYNDRAVAGRFDWGVAPIPTNEGKQRRTLFQGTNVGIFNNTTDVERKKAWDYLQFMTNTDNATLWAINTGYLPIRKSCLKHPDMVAYLKDNPNYAAVVPELENGTFEPRIEQWESMRNVITREFDSFINGRKNIDEFINDSKEKCEYILIAE